MTDEQQLKKCPRCQEFKSLELFKATTRLLSYCKPCMSAYVSERRRLLGPLHTRRYAVKKIIPTITKGELDHIIDKCEYKCQICGNEAQGKDLHLDHDDTRKIIRGWLCQRCNVGIGYFKDNPEVLRRAANYLETANLLADFVAPRDKV